MSGKKEKIATKKALPLEATWRLRLACLNAAARLRPDRDENHTSSESKILWSSTEKELTSNLRHRIDHKEQKSSFFFEDFDALALDLSFSMMAQMEQTASVDLNTLGRWGSYSSRETPSEALRLLELWQNRFRLDHDLVEMARSVVLIQNLLFQQPQSFHLHSDGQTLMAVWEGRAIERFHTQAPQQLLDLEKLPHALLFNRRDGHNAQMAAIWPLTAPIGVAGRLRCLIILEPIEEKNSISLQTAG